MSEANLSYPPVDRESSVCHQTLKSGRGEEQNYCPQIVFAKIQKSWIISMQANKCSVQQEGIQGVWSVAKLPFCLLVSFESFPSSPPPHFQSLPPISSPIPKLVPHFPVHSYSLPLLSCPHLKLDPHPTIRSPSYAAFCHCLTKLWWYIETVRIVYFWLKCNFHKIEKDIYLAFVSGVKFLLIEIKLKVHDFLKVPQKYMTPS